MGDRVNGCLPHARRSPRPVASVTCRPGPARRGHGPYACRPPVIERRDAAGGTSVSRFEWVAGSARLLQQTGEEFERTRPFDGLRIGTGIHLEPKTAALLLTLQRGGATVVSTGNLNSTQQET